MSAKLFIFACDAECAEQVFQDNCPEQFPQGYVQVTEADDLAGQTLETLEIAKCYHRWTAGVQTAWNHMEWCIWQLEPCEVRWANDQRK